MRVFLRKLLFTLIISISFLLTGTTSYAIGSYSLVSGPSGGVMRNGWYIYNLGVPIITIQAGNGSNCGGSGIFTLPLSPGGGDNMGSHILRYFYAPDDPKANLWVSRDGILLGTMCNQDKSYVGSTVTVWQGTLKYDGWAPVVNIISPSNNTNTNSETITVSGNVYDTGDDYQGKCLSISRCSLISKVTVNGIAASINGDTYSINVPLNKGLNTLKAVAVDNAGFTTESQSITVLRSEEVGNNNSDANASANGQNGNNQAGSEGSSEKEKSKNNHKKPENIIQQAPTPVKVAVGLGAAGLTGLGVASYFGYIPYRRIGLFIAKIFMR